MIPLLRRCFVFCTPLAFLLVCSMTGLAGTTTEDATRAAARAAGYEGIEAYQKGDLPVAVDKLGRAFDVVKVPTLGLWYARALAKTGKLVEAAERYEEVARLEVTERKVKVKEQKQAQAQAADELVTLRSRIPSLTWTIQGADEACEVTVNGSSVPLKLMGLATPMNPGTYQIQAKQGAQVIERSVTLAEGEKKSVELKLIVSTATQPTKVDAEQTKPVTNTQAPPKPSRTGVYVGIAATGVFAVAATVAGLMARSQQNEFDDAKQRDDRAAAQTASDFGKTLALVTDISIGAAIVSAGVTTYFLFSSPSKPTEKSASTAALQFAPVVGRGTVGLGVSSRF